MIRVLEFTKSEYYLNLIKFRIYFVQQYVQAVVMSYENPTKFTILFNVILIPYFLAKIRS